MTTLADGTVTGDGEIDGYVQPAFLYAEVTILGIAHPVDVSTEPRYVDIGWYSYYFYIDLGLGTNRFYFPVRWLNFERTVENQLLTLFPGGVDGLRYSLRPGVEVHFRLTD